jgi:hypothetical protein
VIFGWFACYCSARATLIEKLLRHDLYLGVSEVGMKLFDEESGIWRPISWQGCHYWRQGLVAKVGTKRKMAKNIRSQAWAGIERFFGNSGWTKNVISRIFFLLLSFSSGPPYAMDLGMLDEAKKVLGIGRWCIDRSYHTARQSL